MTKTKLDWLKEAKNLGLNVTPKSKITDIKAAIEQAGNNKQSASNKEQTASSKGKAGATSRRQTAKSEDRAGENQTATDDTAEAAPDYQLQPQDSNLAKAGRRSKKGLEEAEDRELKEARKRGDIEVEAAQVVSKRGPAPKTRSRLERRSKTYRQKAEKIDGTKTYNLADALKLAVDTSTTKFDASVELHVRLDVDPKQADQNIRETVSLPNGTGKTVRIAVFAPPDEHDNAKKAGADLVGEKEILDRLAKEQIDFDVLIATPQVMSQLGRFAKLLGPKGLMPNPKSGTVTANVAEAVKSARAGRVELRVDKQGIIHTAIGKVSFGADKLLPNAQSVLSAIKAAKPASVKGGYVVSMFVTTTMGPSIKVGN